MGLGTNLAARRAGAALLVAAALAAQAPANLPALEARVKDNPTDAAAWKRLGMARAAQLQSEGALSAFSEACRLDPKEEDACYYLGRQLLALGRHSDAVPPFEAAVRAAPPGKRGRTHRAAALNLAASGAPAEAERHFRNAAADSAAPAQVLAEVHTDYGAFLFRQSRPEEALRELRRAVKLHPARARAHAELGRVLLHSGKPEQAAAALERALELDNRPAGIRLLLGRAYMMLGRTEEGERQLELGRQDWEKKKGPEGVR